MQVSNWFANARRRLKNVVQESHCSWSKRLRLYNQFVQGNAELLSISSDDSIWNSDDEEDSRKKQRKIVLNTDEDEDVIIDTEDQNSKESIQYKKTMMQRYLNDALEAKNSKPSATSTTVNVISESPGKTDNTLNAPAVPTTYLTAAGTPSTYSRMYWPPPPPPVLPPLPGVFPWLPLPPTLLNASQNGKTLRVIALYLLSDLGTLFD